ncbi:MAG: PH domain-containing protein [Candidatus Saccharibacteria bacterium]|nr:PH domain-containing protein [Candidatus Saccharibacteria bacterium]
MASKSYCPNCGAVNQGTNFCTSCGQQLNDEAEKSAKPNRAETTYAATPTFRYPKNQRHSDIITKDDSNGEPIVTFRNLHPNAVWLFFFQYLGKSSILLLLFVIVVFFEPFIAIAAIVAYFMVLFLVSKMTYENYEFEVSTVAFRITHGIFHKYSVNIAFNQVQNINMRRSILDQMLGLAHLELETSGTGGEVEKRVGGLATVSEGYIPGVDPDEARDIKALMLARIGSK